VTPHFRDFLSKIVLPLARPQNPGARRSVHTGKAFTRTPKHPLPASILTAAVISFREAGPLIVLRNLLLIHIQNKIARPHPGSQILQKFLRRYSAREVPRPSLLVPPGVEGGPPGAGVGHTPLHPHTRAPAAPRKIYLQLDISFCLTPYVCLLYTYTHETRRIISHRGSDRRTSQTVEANRTEGGGTGATIH
jgi:hypothetical protein